MKKTSPVLSVALFALTALAGATGCTGKYKRPTTADKVAATPEAVARGRYLVDSVASCGFCHTPRTDGSWLAGERTDAYLAGGMVFDEVGAGFKVRVPNLTPDVETGLGAWTDDQILRAIRDGVHRDDTLLWPPMLFYMYDLMSDDDARAIVAYLRTIPPVKNATPRLHEAGFFISFMVNRGLMHHKPAHDVKGPAPGDAKAQGAYLARIGACADCHSLTSMGPDLDKNLLGGGDEPMELPGMGKIWPRNLTPDPETGLGKYTADQIKQAIRTGKRLDGSPIRPPMSLIIPHVSTMSEEDLDALVGYIRSVKPIKRKVHDPELTPEANKSVGL